LREVIILTSYSSYGFIISEYAFAIVLKSINARCDFIILEGYYLSLDNLSHQEDIDITCAQYTFFIE